MPTPETLSLLENPDSEPLILLESDLTEEANFGSRTLIVTKSAVEVREPGGATLLRTEVSDLRGARTEPLVSGGRLLLRLKSGEEITAISFSLTHSHQFSEAARGIEQLAEGKDFQINLTSERTRCAKCNRLLPEKDGVCPNCVNTSKTMLRIASFLAPYKKQAIFLALMACVSTGLNLLPPKLQATILDHFNEGLRSLPFLYQMVGFWAITLVAVAGLQILNGRLMTFLGTHISSDLRTAVYRSVEFLQLNYFDKKPVGAIASRVTQDTERVWFFLVDGLPFFLINGLMLIAVTGLLLSINWVLALCILAPLPLVGFISVRAWKPISNLFHRVSQKMARVHMHLNESLTGIRVVKAFAKEDHEYERFQKRSNELRDAAARADMTWYTAFGVMTLCVSLGTVIHWSVGGYMLFTNRLSLGEFYMIHAYLGMVYGPLQWFAQVNNWFSRAMAGAERIFEIMDMTPEPAARKGLNQVVTGAVTFESVRFGYDKSNPVINGVSFDVKAGEMIGLVGHSGAGKSTTINLLSRFYEPDAGRILVDGIDYREFDLRGYRSQIGIVLQEPFLFHGTIAENISYGNPGASLEEIMEAAKAANAHDFILGKPDGYDTMVGERGSRLSGGEKQRISIARAILHNPRILILDEATSSVDVETEKQIQVAIQRLVSGRTTFAIAHRLSTLRNADRLIVLERGKIAEMGTHEELMTKKGAFYKLVQTQSQINEIIGIGTGA
ncbi:MAG: ABC transporter ATP-binding protein/permease [Fimbriimonadaceae bacterium]|jgi:ATP-binding cassette subfamily B protein|nr:ABC transporter ATP-binding protein/permease [Fimbriimonadaceae bacterium]